MITVKDAILAALRFVAESFNMGSSADPIASLRLEEVEPSDDGKYWFITVSLVRGVGPRALGAMLGSDSEESEHRDYKTVTVEADTGAVTKVKIRELA